MKTVNILICGVGGQGVLLAGDIIAEAAMACGHDAKKSEVHGMAQRGGSVVSHVRYGDKVHSPLIRQGEADVVLSFEEMETARYLDFLGKEGTVIINRQQVMPMTVATGKDEYPDDIVERIKSQVPGTALCPGMELAEKAGSPKTINMVLLGALSKRLELPTDKWLETISRRVPPKTVDMNKKAFELGRGC
ncbi:MAG TPA: indolepyruvate oxidoreductase subunit beta [candidate division Zixibacteria bacterium]|nr:indolepyruvate oxidoreductase subunit beta [candidate division Zixibacteria bacterium]